jgi:type IV pilus assembly protein PilM
MALPLPTRKGPRGTVGLDIDGAYLAAVSTSGGRVQSAASAELPNGLMSDGEVIDVSGLGNALKDFFRAYDLPRNVRIGVSNQQIVVREIELPEIPDEQEREMAIRFQAAEAIAMPLDEAVLDHQVVGYSTDQDGHKRMRMIVVAARESMITALVSAVREAGLKPEGIDLDAFALLRTLAAATPDSGAAVYCHLAGVTNLAIAAEGACVFTRPLAASWDSNAESSASELADEIRLSIDSYSIRPGAMPVTDVILSGPGSHVEGLMDHLGSLLGVPVSIAPPLGAMGAGGIPAGDDPYRYTIAAGLAMGAAA